MLFLRVVEDYPCVHHHHHPLEVVFEVVTTPPPPKLLDGPVYNCPFDHKALLLLLLLLLLSLRTSM